MESSGIARSLRELPRAQHRLRHPRRTKSQTPDSPAGKSSRCSLSTALRARAQVSARKRLENPKLWRQFAWPFAPVPERQSIQQSPKIGIWWMSGFQSRPQRETAQESTRIAILPNQRDLISTECTSDSRRKRRGFVHVLSSMECCYLPRLRTATFASTSAGCNAYPDLTASS